MTPDIQYVATLPHVREVSIVGTADLGFWAARLREEKLTPLEVDGRAQLLVMAADSRFMGLPFREVSFSVALAPPDGGAFLAQAFNSRRFFAFCERTFFKTPYAFAEVRVATSPLAGIQIIRGSEVLFRAEMGEGATPATGPVPYQEGWEGALFLPSRGQEGRRLFFARIRGAAEPAVFEASRDRLEHHPAEGLPFLQALIDSRFQPTHWLVRRDATHAKSKTYRR